MGGAGWHGASESDEGPLPTRSVHAFPRVNLKWQRGFMKTEPLFRTPVPASRDSERHRRLAARISSYTPRVVAVLLGLGAAVALTAGLRQWPVSDPVSLALLALGVVDLAASTMCL